MDAKLKADWIAALRSGEYEQTRGGLVGLGSERTSKNLCCLGVLWAICGRPQNLDKIWNEHVPDSKRVLISMNDEQCKSFPEIADYIEREIP